MSQGFIEQTANDYDMPACEVKRISELLPNFNQFYEKLEEYISIRSKQNNNPIHLKQ